MTIKEYSSNTKPNRILDLSGPEGNAYALLGIAQKFSNNLKKDTKKILQEMESADYGNLVYVFNREFGQYFEILLPQGMSLADMEDSYQKAQKKAA